MALMALSILSFLLPQAGIALFFAGLPLILCFGNNPAFYFSGAESFLALVLLAGLVRHRVDHFLLPPPRAVWLALGILTFFSLTPIFRFADLILWHPIQMASILWLHLYHGDQLSPFAFVHRGWIYALGIMLFFGVRAQSGMSKLKWIYWGLLCSGAVLAAFSIFDVLRNKRAPINYFAIFDDRNTYAALFVVAISLLAWPWAKQKQGWKKVLIYALFMLFSLLIFASLSLSAMGAWLLTVLLSVFTLGRESLRQLFRLPFYKENWGKLLVLFLCLYFLFPTLAFLYPPSDPISVAEAIGQRIRSLTPENIFETVYRGRAHLWAAGWEMFKEYPVFGIGIGRYYLMSNQFFLGKDIRSMPGGLDYQYENAHNYFLQLLAEIGLAGFACFISLIVWLLLRPWDLFGKSMNTAAGIAVVALLALSVTGHPLLVQSLLFMGAAVAAVVAGPLKQNPSSSWFREKKVWIPVMGMVLILYAFHLKAIWNQLPPKFQWGFYHSEGTGEEAFKWTRRLALIQVSSGDIGPFLIRAQNPDLSEDPLNVMVYANEIELMELVLRSQDWQVVQLPARWKLPDQFVLGIKTSRTWSPADYGFPDYRELGVMVRGHGLHE